MRILKSCEDNIMNEKYLTLFKELARATELLSEQVMEYDKSKNDEKGFTTAESMRKDYADLYDRLCTDDYQITLKDFLKLFVSSYIVSENIEAQIKTKQTALDGYKKDLMPKLKRIADETHTDEEAMTLANEIFQITD